MSVIVALSGGKASGWCANWALENYPKDEVILYFNDTKWEHPDLYRFLKDLALHFNHPIIEDSDGRSPHELFIDHHALANDRMPFCSSELKAKRLQKFYKNEDTLIFGIGIDEPERALRIVQKYQLVAVKTNKYPKILFPLIENNISKEELNAFFVTSKIIPPVLYDLKFTHNNCSGGCVRAGKKQWKLLYEKLPEVYALRENTEEKLREYTGKDIHIFKDETLKHFRERIVSGKLSSYYDTDEVFETETECIGVCSTVS